MKKGPRKLALNKETVRTLQSEALQRAEGAGWTTAGRWSGCNTCYTNFCNVSGRCTTTCPW